MGAQGRTVRRVAGESRLPRAHGQDHPLELKSLLNLGPFPATQLFRVREGNIWKGPRSVLVLTQLSSNFLPGPQGCPTPDGIKHTAAVATTGQSHILSLH